MPGIGSYRGGRPRERRKVPLAVRLAGEFAVIVIGVLVALAFDGWRQEREERRILGESLRAIADQIRDSYFTYGRMIQAGVPDKIASLERLIGFLEDDEAPVQDTLLLLTDLSTAAAAPELWNGSDRYESLRSSGQLRLLRDTELATSLAGAYNGVDVLMRQVYRIDGDFRNVALQLLPPAYASRVTPMRGYAGQQNRAWVDARASPAGGLDRFVEDLRLARGELLPLARAELVATEARRFAFMRIRDNFHFLLSALEPWASEPLGDFQLGRSAPGRGLTADFRRVDEVPRAELGATYAEGRWTGSADAVVGQEDGTP
jgi:hypothetical protein